MNWKKKLLSCWKYFVRNTDFISIHLQNSYKTDLLKYYKTLSEETKRFCKEGKGYFTKIFSALKNIKMYV